MSDNKKEALMEVLNGIKDSIDKANEIVPGMGLMIHGLAHAVVECMTPPEGLLKLKEEKPDITQEEVERDYPEIAKEMNNMAGEVHKLVHHCQEICNMSASQIMDEAVKVKRYAEKRREGKSKNESFTFAEDVGEKGAEDMDAPLKDGWEFGETKGNA